MVKPGDQTHQSLDSNSPSVRPLSPSVFVMRRPYLPEVPRGLTRNLLWSDERCGNLGIAACALWAPSGRSQKRVLRPPCLRSHGSNDATFYFSQTLGWCVKERRLYMESQNQTARRNKLY